MLFTTNSPTTAIETTTTRTNALAIQLDRTVSPTIQHAFLSLSGRNLRGDGWHWKAKTNTLILPFAMEVERARKNRNTNTTHYPNNSRSGGSRAPCLSDPTMRQQQQQQLSMLSQSTSLSQLASQSLWPRVTLFLVVHWKRHGKVLLRQQQHGELVTLLLEICV